MRNIVKKGYDEGNYDICFSRNSKKIDHLEKGLFNELISRIKGKKILDLGCGTGFPYSYFFVNKGFDLTGIDISEKHIKLAKKNIKNVNFILGDFFSNKINNKYDAIISCHAIFHIPRNEHLKLFKKIYSLLKKEGLILISLATESFKYSVNENFCGSRMVWSSFNLNKNKKLIKEAGFNIINILEDYRTEKHMWVLAKK